MTHADIAFSPDGHLLALSSGNGQVTIWDVVRLARHPGRDPHEP